MSNFIQIKLINHIYESFCCQNTNLEGSCCDLGEINEEDILNAFHFIFYDSNRLVELALDILDKGSITGYIVSSAANTDDSGSKINCSGGASMESCLMHKVRSNVSNPYQTNEYMVTAYSCSCRSYLDLFNKEMIQMNNTQVKQVTCGREEYYESSNSYLTTSPLISNVNSNNESALRNKNLPFFPKCICKHMLAIRIGYCLNKIDIKEISMKQYINLLNN